MSTDDATQMATPRVSGPWRSLDERSAQGVWRLLCEADQEFVPSLSSRESSTTDDLGAADAHEDGPRTYFESLQEQSFFLAHGDDGELMGFMTYRPGHELPRGIADGQRFLYITTIIVGKPHRRRGASRALYAAILAESQRLETAVATRTWSSNHGHLALLDTLGFHVVHRLPDDRGAGLDTVYVTKEPHA